MCQVWTYRNVSGWWPLENLVQLNRNRVSYLGAFGVACHRRSFQCAVRNAGATEPPASSRCLGELRDLKNDECTETLEVVNLGRVMPLRSTGLGKDTSTSEYTKRFDLYHQLEKQGTRFVNATADLSGICRRVVARRRFAKICKRLGNRVKVVENMISLRKILVTAAKLTRIQSCSALSGAQ